MKITYFLNHYPKASHSFIRREILALERLGFEIQRIALHGWDEPLPDEEDQRERTKTRYVLEGGAGALLLPALKTMLQSPVRFARAVASASFAAATIPAAHTVSIVNVDAAHAAQVRMCLSSELFTLIGQLRFCEFPKPLDAE